MATWLIKWYHRKRKIKLAQRRIVRALSAIYRYVFRDTLVAKCNPRYLTQYEDVIQIILRYILQVVEATNETSYDFF